MATPSDLLSVAQVAAEIGIPVRTLLYRIKTGKVVATKLGDNTSAYVITRAEVDRLKEEAAA